MNWSVLAQMATTASALFAAGSLFAVYNIYRNSKRDGYIKTLRVALSRILTNCNKLNHLATYDLLHDLSYNVVYRTDLQHLIWQFIEQVREQYDSSWSEEQLKEYVKEHMPSITCPIDSKLMNTYEQIIEESYIEIAPYRFDFPGLYMVIDSVLKVFRNILHTYKRIVRDEDLWKNVIVRAVTDDTDSIDKVVCDANQYMVQGLLYIFKNKKDQDDIDDMLRITTLVTTTYMNLADKKLYRLSKKEKKAGIGQKDTEYITDDLYEAEKVLRNVLTHEEVLDYNRWVTSFYERNRPRQE